jgi:hypothetical protein
MSGSNRLPRAAAATGEVVKDRSKALQDMQQSNNPMALRERSAAAKRRWPCCPAVRTPQTQRHRHGPGRCGCGEPLPGQSSRDSSCCGRTVSRGPNEQKHAPPNEHELIHSRPMPNGSGSGLAEEPTMTPKEPMERLIEEDPECDGMRHLRKMQRRVSGYRLAQIGIDCNTHLGGESYGPNWHRRDRGRIAYPSHRLLT